MLRIAGTTADSYTIENSYSYPNTVAGRLELLTTGKQALVQVGRGSWSLTELLDEELLNIGIYQLVAGTEPISGIRLRSAVAGQPVDYTGALYLKQDPVLVGATRPAD